VTTSGQHVVSHVSSGDDGPDDRLRPMTVGDATRPMLYPTGPGEREAHEENTANLVRLHESIASLLASHGEWRQAYEHLRSALRIACAEVSEQPHVPEQFRREVDRLRREHAEAREQSIRDSLTASYNRRYLDQQLISLLTDQRRTGDGLAVALVDLDWFKQVNDTYGHPLGDQVLRRVVALLQHGLPDGAFCARYGGDEFVLVLPGVDGPSAVGMAEEARARVEDHEWSGVAPRLRVTVSIGVSIGLCLDAETDGTVAADPAEQLRQADVLLYAAKHSGRNAVAYRWAGETCLAGPASARRTIIHTPAAGESLR